MYKLCAETFGVKGGGCGSEEIVDLLQFWLNQFYFRKTLISIIQNFQFQNLKSEEFENFKNLNLEEFETLEIKK